VTDQDSRPVDAIANAYVDRYAALDPITATSAGVAGHDDRLTDLSPDGFAAREALTRSALADAQAATPVDAREQVAKDAFVERLGLQVERYDAGLPQSQVAVISSGLHEIREVFDLMDTDTTEAWENVDARLGTVAATVAGYRKTLLQAADEGRVSARRQLHQVARQVRHWTGQEGHGGNFFLNLVAGSPATGTLRDQLERHAAEASDAFAGFGRFLDDELGPRGQETDAVGRELDAL
jgi:uncharacterized protein (DUF885 family)